MFDLSDLTPQSKEEAAELALQALAFIEKLVAGNSEAASVVMVMRALITALREYRDGKITAEDVRHEIRHLSTAIGANDAAANEALREKFGKKDGES